VKYCIFGGSFDPPHAGHTYLAQNACSELHFDKIFWVPTADPPHKTTPSTLFQDRVAMVRLMIAGKTEYMLSEIELTLPRPSYSLNLIRALKVQYGPDHDWHFLIGADNWAIFPNWHQGQEVLKQVTMVVFPRKGYPFKSLPAGIMSLDMPEMHIESSQIRETLALNGDLAEANVPTEIRTYIVQNQLYGMGVSP
jgi:nicotinate-nucleotide adenylyltransferase